MFPEKHFVSGSGNCRAHPWQPRDRRAAAVLTGSMSGGSALYLGFDLSTQQVTRPLVMTRAGRQRGLLEEDGLRPLLSRSETGPTSISIYDT